MAKYFTPTIGKDVIESLTIGMYEDSKFIYREYIQNAADQIDKAVKEGLLKTDAGEIYINIDSDNQIISIEDNATGIAQAEVLPILQNIAASTKQRGIDKGFRGIGRLGGLGYCETLVFETSFKGEAVKSKMTWNAAQLKKILNDRSKKEEAATVLAQVTKHETAKEDMAAHYFRVTLTGVTNPDLLNVKNIRNYLSMVAPVPFENHFIFKSKIYDELKKENIHLDEYAIFINTEQLFKGYSTHVYEGEEGNKRRIDELIDIVFFKETDDNSNLLYLGWYGLSTFQKQLNVVNKARGLRLRKSNIQIGNEYTLSKLHREPRGNFYFLGEVYAIHPDLIPNSRRDYFTENDQYLIFERKLKSFFHTQLYKLYYAASEINSAVKKIGEFEALTKVFEQKQQQGFTDKDEHQELLAALEQKKEEAKKAENKIQKFEQNFSGEGAIPVKKILDKVTTTKKTAIETKKGLITDEKPKFRTDKLSTLSKEERKFLGKVFSIIRDVLEPKTAEELVTKIEEELK